MTSDASINPLDPSSWPSHCAKCGVALTKVRQCMGHRTNGDHCGKMAVRGMRVCATHGGSLGRSKAAAVERIEQARAARLVITYGAPREVDPHTALLEELHRTAGHVAWLGELVASLQHEDDPQPTVLGNGGEQDPAEPHATRSGLKQYTRTEKFTVEQESVWLRMYRDERAHLAKVAKDCIAAGIAERQVRINEDMGRQLGQFIASVLPALGLDPMDPAVRSVVEPKLRALQAVA